MCWCVVGNDGRGVIVVVSDVGVGNAVATVCVVGDVGCVGVVTVVNVAVVGVVVVAIVVGGVVVRVYYYVCVGGCVVCCL